MNNPAATTAARPPALPQQKPGRSQAGRPAAGQAKTKAQAQAKPASFAFLKPSGTRPFKKKDLIQLFRGIGSMLRAQINTSDALKYYGQGLPNKEVTSALLSIREDINAGMSVHEAFRRTGRFNDMTLGLIQAGSDAGQMHEAFTSLASRLTSEAHFRKAVRKAVTMPAIVISILIGAFIVSQIKIVPQVEDMLDSVNQSPDGLTALAFKVSHFTQAVWPFVIVSLIASIVVICVSDKVRNVILNLAMSKWRLLRNLIMSLRQMTFLATIKLLHSNGINLAKSIRVSANSVKGTPFYQELRDAAEKYEASGVPLSTSFAKYTSVDPQVVHMLSIGEKSASIDSQLEMLTGMYEEDAETHMNTFTAAINFIVLLIAVGLIAAVFIGTFLPIFLMGPKMMQSGM